MKNENSMYATPKYKCGVCGEIYDSIKERMNCENTCLKKQAEEERKAAEAKKKAEKDARKAEVDEALKKFTKLAEAYANDYGSYEYDGELIPNVFLSNKLWHHFWY